MIDLKHLTCNPTSFRVVAMACSKFKKFHAFTERINLIFDKYIMSTIIPTYSNTDFLM